LTVVNLFAYRATSPQALKETDDPIGPENDQVIRAAATHASQVIVAWGNHGVYQQRDQAVLALLAPASLFCLGITRAGNPVHPLYQPAITPLQPFPCTR
jgi:hypothetical protein